VVDIGKRLLRLTFFRAAEVAQIGVCALLSWLVIRERGATTCQLVEQQIAERRERARDVIAKILERPGAAPYGDYRIKSASGKTYRVAVRGPGLFENYCSCPDFAVNTLGTCKHIEALLLRLRKRYGHTLESKAFARSHASISLQYGETIDVRLHLPAGTSPRPGPPRALWRCRGGTAEPIF
jgi:hypothetical protein